MTQTIASHSPMKSAAAWHKFLGPGGFVTFITMLGATKGRAALVSRYKRTAFRHGPAIWIQPTNDMAIRSWTIPTTEWTRNMGASGVDARDSERDYSYSEIALESHADDNATSAARAATSPHLLTSGLLSPSEDSMFDESTIQPSNSSSTPRRSHARRIQATITYPPPPGPEEFPAEAYLVRDFFRFEIVHQSTKSRARVGRIHTPHGTIDTPGFVAVATNAALKGVEFRDATTAGQQLIFCNTYHLMLHPGADLIARAGGIHAFTGRKDGPFITDSGGFQVFSLAYGSVHEELASKGELKRSSNKVGKDGWRADVVGTNAVQITEEGALFRSYRDGNKFLLTPESTVQAQKKIGADIIIPLDELPGYYVDRDRLVASVERTHRWEARSLKQHLIDVKEQAMYCVVHGGVDYELRRQSVDYLTSLPFDGYAIGGSLGSTRDELKELLSFLMPLFDTPERKGKPTHLLGIADEENIRFAVQSGLDTMDSCYPTRLGRHGTLLTRKGMLRIKSGKHSNSFGVKIDDQCFCKTCQQYDRAYLWHLFKANEPIAVTLAAHHNIQYTNDLMAQLRQDIMDDRV